MHKSVVTSEFTDEGGKTRLVVTARYPSLEVRNTVLASGMASGAAISYDRLEDLVAELQRSRPDRSWRPGNWRSAWPGTRHSLGPRPTNPTTLQRQEVLC